MKRIVFIMFIYPIIINIFIYCRNIGIFAIIPTLRRIIGESRRISICISRHLLSWVPSLSAGFIESGEILSVRIGTEPGLALGVNSTEVGGDREVVLAPGDGEVRLVCSSSLVPGRDSFLNGIEFGLVCPSLIHPHPPSRSHTVPSSSRW